MHIYIDTLDLGKIILRKDLNGSRLVLRSSTCICSVSIRPQRENNIYFYIFVAYC